MQDIFQVHSCCSQLFWHNLVPHKIFYIDPWIIPWQIIGVHHIWQFASELKIPKNRVFIFRIFQAFSYHSISKIKFSMQQNNHIGFYPIHFCPNSWQISNLFINPQQKLHQPINHFKIRLQKSRNRELGQHWLIAFQSKKEETIKGWMITDRRSW